MAAMLLSSFHVSRKAFFPECRVGPCCLVTAGDVRQSVGGQRTGSRKGQSAFTMSFCLFNGGEKFKEHFKPGIYVCGKCGYELFSSRSKFEHSSPWPAFTETIHEDSVSKKKEDRAAYKVSCGKCGNGLGHEFINDGPQRGQSRF